MSGDDVVKTAIRCIEKLANDYTEILLHVRNHTNSFVTHLQCLHLLIIAKMNYAYFVLVVIIICIFFYISWERGERSTSAYTLYLTSFIAQPSLMCVLGPPRFPPFRCSGTYSQYREFRTLTPGNWCALLCYYYIIVISQSG